VCPPKLYLTTIQTQSNTNTSMTIQQQFNKEKKTSMTIQQQYNNNTTRRKNFIDNTTTIQQGEKKLQ